MCDPEYCYNAAAARLPDQLRQFLGSLERSRPLVAGPIRPARPPGPLRGPPRRSGARADRSTRRAAGCACDPARVRIAVEFSDFRELQRQERSPGLSRASAHVAREPFFRRGEVGAWRDELPAPLADRLVQAHGEMMPRFGYLEGGGLIDPDAIVTRNDEMMSAPVDREIVFLDQSTDSYVALDEVGRRIWDLLERPRRLGELVDLLCAEFDGAASEDHRRRGGVPGRARRRRDRPDR